MMCRTLRFFVACLLLGVALISGCQEKLPPLPPGFETGPRRDFLGSYGYQIEPVKDTGISREWVYRSEALAVAEAYRVHRWLPAEANLFHGYDTAGIRVDTPDVGLEEPGGYWRVGQVAQSVPYRWGGFESLAEFDAGLKRGLAAGDIYSEGKRAGLESQVSERAVGIDCSGLISRAWRLPRAYSTRTLPSLCVELPSYEQMRAGDIFNIHNHHVMLFVGWVGEEQRYAEIIEVGARPFWGVHRHAVPRDFLLNRGYKAYRYRGIREDPADGSRPWL